MNRAHWNLGFADVDDVVEALRSSMFSESVEIAKVCVIAGVMPGVRHQRLCFDRRHRFDSDSYRLSSGQRPDAGRCTPNNDGR